MEYTTNGDLLTIHGKYMHNIFRIPTRHKLEKQFFAKDILQQNHDKAPRYTTYYRFLQQQIRRFHNDLLRLELGQIINPGNTLILLQHLNMTSEIFSKILQYFSKIPPEDAQQHTDNEIANLQQRIQCIICTDQERNTLLLPCKHFKACRECLLRCHNKCPLCRTVITQMISVLC